MTTETEQPKQPVQNVVVVPLGYGGNPMVYLAPNGDVITGPVQANEIPLVAAQRALLHQTGIGHVGSWTRLEARDPSSTTTIFLVRGPFNCTATGRGEDKTAPVKMPLKTALQTDSFRYRPLVSVHQFLVGLN